MIKESVYVCTCLLLKVSMIVGLRSQSHFGTTKHTEAFYA